MSKKLLIVDDDEALCKTWQAILTQKGYKVKTINYGYLAFVEMKNKPYDLVLMDLNLAGIDGVRTYKEIKKVKPNIKVVIMTGYALDDIGSLIEEGVSFGMIDAALRKPVDPDKLIEVIEKHTA
jgi:DNA-binding NtrC family response regulator